VSFWKQYQKQITTLVKVLLFFLLLYTLYANISSEEFSTSLKLFQKEFSWKKFPYFFAAVTLIFFNWGFETLKYYLSVQKLEPISFFRSYRGILFGNALNLILPASIGELTGRPLVLQSQNRLQGSAIAYFVSIAQKLASPLMGLIFFYVAHRLSFLDENMQIAIFGRLVPIGLMVVAISIFDFLFWFLFFWKPEKIVVLVSKIDKLQPILSKIPEILKFSLLHKIKLFGIGAFRFLIFVVQYWLLTFVFFEQFDEMKFFILIGVYFLTQFVIPSFGFLDLGIRPLLIMFIFHDYKQNILQLYATNYLIYLLNIVIPSLFGFYLMRHHLSIKDQREIEGLEI
jgi:hypothetical protein